MYICSQVAKLSSVYASWILYFLPRNGLQLLKNKQNTIENSYQYNC